MTRYHPKDELEIDHLKLVIGMTTECLMGKGCDTRKCYTDNLRRVADAIDKLPEEKAKEP